jgi:hypothetical protein
VHLNEATRCACKRIRGCVLVCNAADSELLCMFGGRVAALGDFMLESCHKPVRRCQREVTANLRFAARPLRVTPQNRRFALQSVN